MHSATVQQWTFPCRMQDCGKQWVQAPTKEPALRPFSHAQVTNAETQRGRRARTHTRINAAAGAANSLPSFAEAANPLDLPYLLSPSSPFLLLQA